MTNPTLEQRARELFEIARPNFHYAKRGTADGGAFEQSEIGRCLMNAMKAIASSPTFSHTGVEQAIEACAKDGCVMVPREPTEEMVEVGLQAIMPRRRDVGFQAPDTPEAQIARAWDAMIRATLPAQSPDDIAYAGAVQGETYAQFQQSRGRLPDLIEEAIEIYTGFMKDDDYNAQGCLDSVVAKLKSARDWYPGAAAHPDSPAPSPVNVEGLVEALGPFARVAALQLPIASNWATDRPAVEWLPTGWPGWGDFLRAYEAIGGHDGIAALNDAEEARRQTLAALSPDGER